MKSEGNGASKPVKPPIHLEMKLDKQLKALLRENDINVAQLARKAGVSSKTIYNWLEGQMPRDIGAVKKVADHFGVTLDFLCYEIATQKPSSEIERHIDEINAGVFEVVLRRSRKGP